MKKSSQYLIICSVAVFIFLFVTGALADVIIPIPDSAMPPLSGQIQHPSGTESVRGESVPVGVRVQTAQGLPVEMKKVKENVRRILENILKKSNAVIVISQSALPVATDIKKGYAKNLIMSPVKPKRKVEAVIGALKKNLLGSAYIPVIIKIEDGHGKVIATSELKYQHANQNKFAKDAAGFIGKHINLASRQPAVSHGTARAKEPELHAWIESSNGPVIRIGSRLVIHYTSDTDGYVSIYHFGSSGNVQRIYPNPREPYNFIKKGKTYRYPASGWLTVKGPAGNETIKLIFTTLPSNTPRKQPGDLSFKMKPLNIIPTHFPVLFSDGDMMRFFALPRHLYTETHINYTLKP